MSYYGNCVCVCAMCGVCRLVVSICLDLSLKWFFFLFFLSSPLSLLVVGGLVWRWRVSMNQEEDTRYILLLSLFLISYLFIFISIYFLLSLFFFLFVCLLIFIMLLRNDDSPSLISRMHHYHLSHSIHYILLNHFTHNKYLLQHQLLSNNESALYCS